MRNKKVMGRLLSIAGLALAVAPAIAGGPRFYGTCNDPSGWMLLCTLAGGVGGLTMFVGGLIANPEDLEGFLQNLKEWTS